MAPEILIVGDDAQRAKLSLQVRRFGYETVDCAAATLDEQLEGGPPLAAIVVCVGPGEAAAIMARLRRHAQSVAVPVTLCGTLGGAIRDLADVLDLGADHFIETPVAEDQLESALQALAGPPAARAGDRSVAPAADSKREQGSSHEAAWPARTEVIDGAADVVPAAASETPVTDRDPVIGQLHRTLDLVAARIRDRDAEPAAESADDLDLATLGLEAVPDVDNNPEILDPADSAERLELRKVATDAEFPARARALPGPREPTVLLEDGTRRLPATHEASDSAASVVHDRPRRTDPLPVDLAGDLRVLEVPRLIWKLHRAGFTGALALAREQADKRLWFERGSLVFAQSNLERDRLIDELVRRGVLTAPQHEAARSLAATAPGRAGRVLVEAGLLKASELPRVVREHLMRIVDSTFPWASGTWQIEPGVTCDEPLTLDTPTAVLILQGIRDRLEAPQLWALLGGPGQHPRLDPRSGADGALELSRELGVQSQERPWLALLDGTRSLEALVIARGVDELALLGLVYGLHVLGLVDLVGEPSPQPIVERAPGEIDRERIEARLRLCREANYFELLGLPLDASRVDVRRAHGELCRTFEDDAIDPQARANMAAELRELRATLDEAKTLLSDDDLRLSYRVHLEDG